MRERERERERESKGKPPVKESGNWKERSNKLEHSGTLKTTRDPSKIWSTLKICQKRQNLPSKLKKERSFPASLKNENLQVGVALEKESLDHELHIKIQPLPTIHWFYTFRQWIWCIIIQTINTRLIVTKKMALNW